MPEDCFCVCILISFGSSLKEWARGGVVVSLSHSREVDGAPEVIRARCALNASQRRKINIKNANTDIIEPNLDTKFQGKNSCG